MASTTYHSDENEFDEVIENTTSLIGTHDEQSELLHEQDQAYFKSLKQDQEKRKKGSYFWKRS